MLVAISIPIFTSQLEKAREATDLANLRAAYAECSAEAITADTASVTVVEQKVDMKQTTAGWATSNAEVAGKKFNNAGTDVDAYKFVSGTPVYVTVTTDGNVEFSTTPSTETKIKKLYS